MTRLSFSKLSRYETCPLSYKLHYIDRLKSEPTEPLQFGTAVHAALETLIGEHVDQELVGPIDKERIDSAWQQAWEQSGMTGLTLFREGLSLVQRFVAEQGPLDHHDVLAVEKEFRLNIGGFEVLGYLDRVDRLGDRSVEIIDYKSNRQLYTRDELDGSLQMSLYHLAAEHLWPWAETVRLTFWMLRHGVKQVTERTSADLDVTQQYVASLGKMLSTAESFPPRLNAYCASCDHRHNCPAYAEALAGKRQFVCKDPDDLDAVAKEREEVARLAKIMYARKSELEDLLKAKLRDQDEVLAGGVRYTMFKVAKNSYPLERTLDLLGAASEMTREQLLERIATVDNKALEGVLKSLGKELPKPQLALLKAELDAVAKKTHSPRLWGKEVRAQA